jgi:anti-sigma regulatory factor (Ser/Thr protein kinase)
MNRSAKPLELTLPARPESAATARRALERYVAGRELDLVAVCTAVSEAVTNAALHAYPDGEGEIDISARFARDRLVVLVADHGTGIRPDTRHAGLGLGLPLIGRLAHEVRVESDRGTRIEMRFAI